VKIGIVDYKAGNLRSVETALKHLGADFRILDTPEELGRMDKLIFPGVGEAGAAMKVLHESGLGDALKKFYASGKPLLGICIGCQIILDYSEEGETDCLGIVPGRCRRFSSKPGFKVPQMGWNRIAQLRGHPLFDGIPDGAHFYFVHSYYPVPENPKSAIAETEYTDTFSSAYVQENLCAVQFHPEKSGEYGLTFLGNFIA
jgi:glutamine amidotransferase